MRLSSVMRSSSLLPGSVLVLMLALQCLPSSPAAAQDPFGGGGDSDSPASPGGSDPFGDAEDDPFGPTPTAPPASEPEEDATEEVAEEATEEFAPDVTGEESDESVQALAEDIEQGVTGTIRRVTLYRDQALVTREIEVAAGTEEEVITVVDLPEQLVPDSVFAEGDEQVQVRAVRVISLPTMTSDRQEVRELERSITANQKAKAELEQELQITSENLTSLSQITSFSATKSSEDLNRGVLNAETVTQLSTYLMEQRRELMLDQLRTQQALADLSRELELLQRKMNELVAGSQSTRYLAKIFIQSAPDAAGILKLNYLVAGCGWSPQYTIRGSVDDAKFRVRYSATVQQISGEPWENVSLTLSTASPSVSATGPTLTPFRISTSENAAKGQQAANMPFDSSQMADRAKSIRREQQSVASNGYGQDRNRSSAERDVRLNQLAAELQQLELQAEAKTAARIAEDADDEVATQVYSLPQPVSLESRRQQQLVQIEDLELEGEMYHVAIPLLASYAYREAEVTNSSPIGLLGGVASVYLDDRFVGQTPLPTTASGQKLVIGFGADQQLRTRRELRSKEDSIRGGNRHLEFTYRLVISNFKEQPVKVRLYDRMPIANETREIAVNLVDPAKPLSEDPLYLRIARQRGILRWDLEVPGGNNGSKAFDVEYTYSLEFDRNQTLTTEELNQQIEADYFFQQQGMGGMGGGMGGMGGFMPGSAGQ